MGLRDQLHEAINEMDRIHPGGVYDFAGEQPGGFLNFVTTASGFQRHFTKKALVAIRGIAATLHANDVSVSSVLELPQFELLVRQCVADLHADEKFTQNDESNLESALKEVRNWTGVRLAGIPKNFTHYYPAWSLTTSFAQPFSLGPVTFLSRDAWIDAVSFSEQAIDNYQNCRETNLRWKDLLKDAVSAKKREQPPGLAGELYRAIKDCPTVLKITVSGLEETLSRKTGEIVCKSALDSVSLLLGGGDFFHQQALANERLQPLRSYSITETNGFLWFPGSATGRRFPYHSGARVRDHLLENARTLGAIGHILDGLAHPDASKHPNLSKRWSTALDWVAEGTRQRNDAVALAKLATGLDVLSCGGKYAGILGMLMHLTGRDEKYCVVRGEHPRTLGQVVKQIYDDGRSQILHGTEFDRLKSFETQRAVAAQLARIALLEAANRLACFSGSDGDKEFRTIPAGT